MSEIISFFQCITSALDQAGANYMVTGSLASTYHSDPRATQDIDIVVEADEVSVTEFVSLLDPNRFYIGDFEAAIKSTDMFNVIETSTGWKVDLVVRKDRPFSHSEFSRRRRVEMLGVQTYVASVEDMILAKLEWSQMGESERQVRDVRSMLDMNLDDLDLEYLDKWASELGVASVFEELLAAAREDAGS